MTSLCIRWERIANEILMCLRAARVRKGETSLQATIGSDNEGNDMTLADILGSDPDMVSNDVERHIQAERLSVAMREVLTPKEAKVLRLRFGLGGGEKYTQRVIGGMLGVSRSYVSRIEKKALKKLRAELED
nr:sigma-70 family RNA polymerase sigma factor [bacterium]